MPFKTNSLLRVCLLACLVLSGFNLFAQKKISGKVISTADKQPVVGATVQVKGGRSAVQTGVDGAFSIDAGDNSTLVISSVGFEKLEIPVAGRSMLGEVSLGTSNTALNEIVVTGYSAQKKKDITGSVAVVDVKSLRSVPGGNPEALLQGQASGVTVISSGVPGGGSNVRIRGITSFGNSDPLYIIDGVQVPNGLHDINSADIESIQVLKDAGSAAIYGVRGSNGVVIVTTKRGKAGKSIISYDGYIGTQRPAGGNPFDIANPTNTGNAIWREFANTPGVPLNATNYKNSQFGYGPTPVLYDYLTPINTNNGGPNTDPSTYALYTNQITKTNKGGTDWYHAVFKPALQQSHTISGSGGNDRSTYYYSVGYYDQQGTLLNTYLRRYSARMNTTVQVKDHIRIGENAYVFYRQAPGLPGSSNQNEGNPISYTYRESPLVPVFDIMGNYAGSGVKGVGNPQNPYANLDRSRNNRVNDWSISGNVFGEVDFLKHFTIRTSFGGSVDNAYNTSFSYTQYENTENNTNPNTFLEASGYNSSRTWTNTLKYTNIWGDHSLSVIAGTEAINNYSRASQSTRSGYFLTNPAQMTVDPALWTLNAGPAAGMTNSSTVGGVTYPFGSSLFSLFGRADYAFKDKYLLSGTIRRDGSSIFAQNVRYGTFESVTAGWRISREDFFKDVSWVNDLKLRGGWGKLGSLSNTSVTNQFTLFGQSAANSSYDITGSSTGSQLGFYAYQAGNPFANWEKDKVVNIGLDGSILQNKFDFSVEWYNKSVSGLLYNAPVQAAGYGDPINAFGNTGDVTNKGIDASVTYHGSAIGHELKFDVTATFSTYKNKVVALANGVKYQDRVSSGSNRFGAFSRLQPGQPVGEFFGYQVIGLYQNQADINKSPTDPAAGVGRFKYADVNHDGKISDSDRTFFGNPNPKFVAGLNLSASYKNFDFSAFFYASVGNKVINYVKYWTDFPQVWDAAMSNRAALQSFGMPGANGKTPILERTSTNDNALVFNSYYMENGSYLRCKQMQIGYSLPVGMIKKFGVDRFRVYIQAANLFTITKYDGLDPELQASNLNDNTNFGIDFGNYPGNQRSYNVGVQLSF
jgi:TonB-linked SusC/RagA family outer membrane protein